MQSVMTATPSIVAREHLSFDLPPDLPRYWFAGDPFKTRFFDACSARFPAGEWFFMACVRDYRDQIKDPALAKDVVDFLRQEAQHSRVHMLFNAQLRQQGIAVDEINQRSRSALNLFRKLMPRKLTLALTAAGEHMTAVTSHGLLERRDAFVGADPRVLAIYIWHAVEEIEHKGVAFDVMQKVARVGYPLRALAMAYITLQFFTHTFFIMECMFRADGIAAGERLRLWLRGLGWLFGKQGLYPPLLSHYLSYYRPGFKPWQMASGDAYQRWIGTFGTNGGDPVAAGASLLDVNAGMDMAGLALQRGA